MHRQLARLLDRTVVVAVVIIDVVAVVAIIIVAICISIWFYL